MRPGGGHTFSGSHVTPHFTPLPHVTPHIEPPHVTPHIEPPHVTQHPSPHLYPHVPVRTPQVVHHRYYTSASGGDSSEPLGPSHEPEPGWTLFAVPVFVSLALLFLWRITK